MNNLPTKAQDIAGSEWEAPCAPGFQVLDLPALLELFKSLMSYVPEKKGVYDRPDQRRKEDDVQQNKKVRG
jgi:hypothetical protein